ncbi:MAG: F0F1 ATP synthase subunit B [Candidatus Dormibacteria bacterium]
MHVVAASAGLLSPNGTLIAEAIAFLLMVGALWRWVYPRVIRMAEQREQAIEAGLQQAQEAEKRLADVRAEVEKLLEEARVQAREITDRAHREAAAEADEVRAKAREEARAFGEQARADIVAERDRALRELRTQVGALVVTAAARVLGDAMDAETHRKLIERSLQSLESLPR